ncbi:SHOCT domain-containing protein [Cryobacterium sp. Hh11]|uniref:SHOCT domain-containing protein n=1 Tax=Cryobacterium sp. Hh11 TaxID=2555868 RepID=UPI00106CF676|nr:SHOCT domain-containing protein [Cryobacterium sp. Hh11]TFD52331.1 SHOCT domain-containing protein [Cryobacterium sp. Hh11]
MMWGNGYNMAWGWPVGLLMLVAVILLVIWIVRALAGGTDRGVSRGGSSAGRGQSGRSQARQILDDRFAKGELNESEYRERLKVLDR